MSLVVSDSGPIHYLVLCGAIEVIPRLYSRLLIPSTVFLELSHPKAPVEVRAWISAMPNWAAVQAAREPDGSSQLGLGEREAIGLALEARATEILIDERLGRRIATQRGLVVTGTVGIMEKGAERGFIILRDALQKLATTNFRIDSQLTQQALAREVARHEREQRERVNQRRGPQP